MTVQPRSNNLGMSRDDCANRPSNGRLEMLSCLADALRYVLPAVSFIALIVGGIAYVTNQPYRDEIDHALKPDLKAPERMLPRGYNADQVRQVKQRLHGELVDDRRTLLDVYVSPVLYWNDIVFAVAIAVFSASLWLWVLLQFEPTGIARLLVIIFAASSVLYGIADVTEDVMLARLFTANRITTGEVRIASVLTQIKMVSITASVAGVMVFFVLSLLTPHKTFAPVNSPAPS
ncbi:hypothetical protein [Bradyrhizobium sp. SEMIA]|uniref:hypothetical protein n=1 Tax=Bradyrhizobium sp. SEMIA TaxID=2597515 RepID=UPI00223EE300|nr:hypothetical protein [Bradyrhizobium sp. SEMIA]